MTALPEITQRDEHKLKLIANVYPADWLNPQPAAPTAHGAPMTGSRLSDAPSPGDGGS